ncbi:MAG: hypothetical protein J7L25_08195, partial [Deltaproteobacteria bacterium]|nr:hypothetical protein [Candidatus Tharpella aukensis]
NLKEYLSSNYLLHAHLIFITIHTQVQICQYSSVSSKTDIRPVSGWGHCWTKGAPAPQASL